MYRIWYSTESFADYIINNTELRNLTFVKNKMYESDANNPNKFHTMPDHIKKILYLDAPDIIVEMNTEPIFSIEVTTEAGTGHNAFQRFARIAASVENGVPSFYIYPEAVIINRRNSPPVWDRINPLIFSALESVMSIYSIPALLYYFPSDFRQFPDASQSPNQATKGLIFDNNIDYAGSPSANSPEMQNMFRGINEVIRATIREGVIEGRNSLLGNLVIRERRNFMNQEFQNKSSGRAINEMSPATSTVCVPTEYILNYLHQYETDEYSIGELLRGRENTIIYKVNANFRGDPYPGALAAIDYLLCREGKTFEERRNNLILLWGKLEIDDENRTIRILNEKNISINNFFADVKNSESKNLLTKDYSELESDKISRYYMQVRYGSTYSKVKHIRVYSYFADAILFPDGSLWRDG